MFRAIPPYINAAAANNRDFLDLVAVRTTVNCVRDYAQMPNVKYINTGSLATFFEKIKEFDNISCNINVD